jgi:hypothetical protein
MKMEWRLIPGYEKEYEISEVGKIRSLWSGRLRRTFLSKFGYVRIQLCRSGMTRHLDVHRLVARAFIGEAPSSLHEVAHNDGNKKNNKVSNLRWATRKENHADKKLHGTAGHAAQKLRPLEARLIRHLSESGVGSFEIARRAGVSHQHVRSIATGKSWHGI